MTSVAWEWFWGREALARAKKEQASWTKATNEATVHAQIAYEAAERVFYPTEPFVTGEPTPMALPLYQQAAHFALCALTDSGPDEPVDRLLDKAPAEILADAKSADLDSQRLKEWLVEKSTASLWDLPADDQRVHVERLKTVTHAWIARLEQRQKAVANVLLRRIIRTGLLALMLVVVIASTSLWVREKLRPPNLAIGKPFVTSSAWGTLGTQGVVPAAPEPFFFHTSEEQNPWIEIDLQSDQDIVAFDVLNRKDCCKDRAVPLIAEGSTDRVTWQELARAPAVFSTWNMKIAKTKLRYFRLRIGRANSLHLSHVALYSR